MLALLTAGAQVLGGEAPMANFRARLKQVEKRVAPAAPGPAYVLVDAGGRILDDGRPAVRPWVGRVPAELPGPLKVYAGFDPADV